jgi:hypothetical protein
VRPARELVEKAVRGGDPIYGVKTGFGALKSVRIAEADVARLQINLIRSHAAGAGPELERTAVRLMLALRAHSLARGASGVRLDLLEHLVCMLELDLLHEAATARRERDDRSPAWPRRRGRGRDSPRAARRQPRLLPTGLKPFTLGAKEAWRCQRNRRPRRGTQAMTGDGRSARGARGVRPLGERGSRIVKVDPAGPRPVLTRPGNSRCHRRAVEGKRHHGVPRGAAGSRDRIVPLRPRVLGASIDALRFARRSFAEVNA